MKTRLLTLIIIGAASLCVCAENKTMFIHHNGQIEPFFFTEIDSIRYSPIDLDSTATAGALVQEIWTPDSTYRYRVTEIDSVTFVSPTTQARPDAHNLEALAEYITGEKNDNDFSLTLLSSIPTTLLPKEGEYIYLEKPSAVLPAGFAGRVTAIESDAGSIVLKCSHAELSEMFTSLAWVGETSFTTDETLQAESMKAQIIALPNLVENLNYPDLIEGSYIMTDELRDIPAGTEQAKISGSMAVHPRIECTMGVYVLPQPDGSLMKMRRMRTDVRADVEASAHGRAITTQKHTVGSANKLTLKRDIGYGHRVTLTYNANMAVKGTIGLDYLYSASFHSSAVSKIVYDNEWNMGMESEFTNKITQRPSYSLSASMDGELSLNGTLSLTMSQSDSLKSVTHAYTYGSALKGDALFLNSQIDGASKDEALYKRLTAHGILAKTTQNIAGTSKYSVISLKTKAKLEKPDSARFYVVPCLNIQNYDDRTHMVTYGISGEPMTFASARLGIAVKQSTGNFRHYTSENIWPGCASSFSTTTDYDKNTDEAFYPTVTLPSGATIIAAPRYPRVINGIYPVAATLESGNIRFTIGAPIIGYKSDNGKSVLVGNFLPGKNKKTSKEK